MNSSLLLFIHQPNNDWRGHYLLLPGHGRTAIAITIVYVNVYYTFFAFAWQIVSACKSKRVVTKNNK